MNIHTQLYEFMNTSLSPEAVTFLSALLPVFELRLAIPLGIIKYGMTPVKVYLLALSGNLVPVLPLLCFFRFFFHRLTTLPVIGKFFSWWFRRVERKSAAVRTFGFWGLVAFVAIPLPVTGAWTGTVAATLMEMKTKKAFLAIAVGVGCAGLVVTILSIFFQNIIIRWIQFA